LLSACSLLALCLLSACPLLALCLLSACSLPALCLLSACPLPALCLLSACSLLALCVPSACPLHNKARTTRLSLAFAMHHCLSPVNPWHFTLSIHSPSALRPFNLVCPRPLLLVPLSLPPSLDFLSRSPFPQPAPLHFAELRPDFSSSALRLTLGLRSPRTSVAISVHHCFLLPCPTLMAHRFCLPDLLMLSQSLV
jgi:hypothetical protein